MTVRYTNNEFNARNRFSGPTSHITSIGNVSSPRVQPGSEDEIAGQEDAERLQEFSTRVAAGQDVSGTPACEEGTLALEDATPKDPYCPLIGAPTLIRRDINTQADIPDSKQYADSLAAKVGKSQAPRSRWPTQELGRLVPIPRTKLQVAPL